MTMPNDRERTIASIRRWARFLPAQWRAVAEWQIRTGRLDPEHFETDEPVDALKWHIEQKWVGWENVWDFLRHGEPPPPVPDWLAALIAKDAVATVDESMALGWCESPNREKPTHGAPTDADVGQAIRAVNDAEGDVTPHVTPHVDGLDVRKVYVAAEPLPSVEKALEIVHGAREQEYGHPADDLRRIGLLWTTHLAGRRTPVSLDDPLTAREVCVLMMLLKSARLARTPDHADSLADVVGYVVCSDRIGNREASK